MAKKGLRAWVKENWVDIANRRSDGSFPKCGRSGGEKRKNYPKCVPIAKARAMSKGQRRSAVARKQAAGNVGPKPTNVKTILKKSVGGYIGSYIKSEIDGKKISNKSYEKYYKGMI
tara:strand:- start:10 stop:357 length:348 start_codon:yes stop_codon:yes gene_type:complete